MSEQETTETYTSKSVSQTDEESEYKCQRCPCPEFVAGPVSTVICRCGHGTKEHGMPF